MATGDEFVELRGDVRRADYDVFDGVSKGRGVSKTALLATILRDWAAREVHVATLVLRMSGGKARDSRPEGDEHGD